MSKTSNTSLPRITPTSVGDLQCSKKFHTLRVLNQWPANGPNSSALFGIALHEVLREVYDHKNGPLPNLALLDVYARQAFFSIDYTNKQHRQEDIQRAIQMIRNYVAQDSDDDISGTVAVEASGKFDIHHNGKPLYELAAKLDRVIVRPNEPNRLICRDYKTGRPKVDLYSACIQLWVAKLLYPSYDSYELQIDWLDNNGLPKREIIEPANVRSVVFHINKKVSLYVAGAEHPAEPCDLCTYCPLKPECQPQKSISIDQALESFNGDK